MTCGTGRRRARGSRSRSRARSAAEDQTQALSWKQAARRRARAQARSWALPKDQRVARRPFKLDLVALIERLRSGRGRLLHLDGAGTDVDVILEEIAHIGRAHDAARDDIAGG